MWHNGATAITEATGTAVDVVGPVLEDNSMWIGIGLIATTFFRISSPFFFLGIVLVGRKAGLVSASMTAVAIQEFSNLVRMAIFGIVRIVAHLASLVNAKPFEKFAYAVLDRVLPNEPPPPDTDYGAFGFLGE